MTDKFNLPRLVLAIKLSVTVRNLLRDFFYVHVGAANMQKDGAGGFMSQRVGRACKVLRIRGQKVAS